MSIKSGLQALCVGEVSFVLGFNNIQNMINNNTMKKIYFLFVALLLTLSAGAQTIPGWTSTNTADGSSSSTTYVLVVSAGSTLTFDWEVGSESNYDWFTITLDGNEMVKKSGVDSGTYTYEFTAPGTHTLVAQYTKDDSKNDNGDYGKIYNINLTVPAAPSTPAGKKGDVNNDGVVNVGDVTSLVDIILYGDEEPATDSRAIDLGLPSGIKWASCNVGATAPEEYGGYYAWGETEEKEDYSWSTYKYCNGSYDSMTKYCTDSDYGTIDNKTTLEPEDDVAHVQWGGSWRMPTKAEQDELRNNCTWNWTTLNGVNGYRITGPNGNSIFLPAAGYRDGTEVRFQGSDGGYLSSSLSSYHSYDAYNLHFGSRYYDWFYYYRYSGRSVRPVCE